jgi:alpha,alpha-trehalose phosphorylase
MAIVFGFAGLRIKEEGLSFQPTLPDNWMGYTFSIQFKGRRLQIEQTAEQTNIKLVDGQSLSIKVFDQFYLLEKDSPIQVS